MIEFEAKEFKEFKENKENSPSKIEGVPFRGRECACVSKFKVGFYNPFVIEFEAKY